ncbi:hypothetical protein M569_06930, partial [Genlisea aurea]
YGSAAVDCTLSLGTPSTRLTTASDSREKKRGGGGGGGGGGFGFSGFGWNITTPARNAAPSTPKPHRGGGGGAASFNAGDPLLARRCANCDTTSTPLWRNGPKGPKSLCNACGIRYKKEERRATAAGGGDMAYGSNWGGQGQKSGSYGYGEEDDYRRDSESGNSGGFLSWRFNFSDRPGFVHEFT